MFCLFIIGVSLILQKNELLTFGLLCRLFIFKRRWNPQTSAVYVQFAEVSWYYQTGKKITAYFSNKIGQGFMHFDSFVALVKYKWKLCKEKKLEMVWKWNIVTT